MSRRSEPAPERPHCCDCPHESYWTVSVKRLEHECESCGARFIAKRECRYYGRAAEHA